MNDDTFLKAFEACTLPGHDFPHRAHIRMAWLYLRAYGLTEGTHRICEGIRRFAESNGDAAKYHDTITQFWARVVYQAITTAPDISRFEDFALHCPYLLEAGLIRQYYTPALLHSAEARASWVEPDIQALLE